MTRIKHNRQSPDSDSAKSRIGIAGLVQPKFVAQNDFLAAYQEAEDATASYPRQLYDGRPHTVFPAVLAVEGVLNEALVTADELAKSAAVWNGRPIVLLHPEERGLPISASAYPEVLERRIGTLFGTEIQDKRLKSQLWLDEKKMDHLGAADLLASMLGDEIVEVSTGYFSDDVLEQGEFEGVPYRMRHINLRPDHLALLPGQVGACSIADGCGAPRTNRTRGIGVKVREALSVLSRSLGVHSNDCNCQECSTMNKLDQVKKHFKDLKLHANDKFLKAVNGALGLKDDGALKANAALESKHLKMLEGLDEDQLGMMSAMIEAYRSQSAAANVEPEPEPEPNEDPEDPAAMKQNKAGDGKPIQITKSELDQLVANSVAKALETKLPEQSRRADVTAKLKANAANPFSEEQLKSLPVDALEATEQALRPADYSGAGGFSVHSGATDDDEPLAVTVNKQLEDRAKARREARAA